MGHLTTRFSSVFGFAFAVLLLIPLWAAFGTFGSGEAGHAEAGHGGSHGGMAGMENVQAMFIKETESFITAYTRSDGCVEPTVGPEEGGHQVDAHAAEEAPVIYLQARQWGYAPARLCLKSGVTYEFKMMAIDVTHGASIQLGPGSKMVRLPPGVEVAQKITFTKPGEYLLYCSSYCGVGHQFMTGQIIVEAGPAQITAKEPGY